MVNNDHPFLVKFVKMYQENEDFQDSLIIQLAHLVLSKMSGHWNPEISVKAMNFFIDSKYHNRKTFSFVSTNLMVPCLLTVQRANGKGRETTIIDIQSKRIKQRLETKLDHS